jgi:PAS domain S-box-containing protein
MNVEATRAKLRFAERLLGQGEGMLAFDRELRYVHWGEGMESISGLSAEEVLGRCALDVFPFLKETGEDKCFHDALQGKSVVASRRPFTVPETGRRGVYEASYSPLEDDDGRVVGGVAIVRDMTDRMREKEHVAEIESRFRNMADVSPVLLWMSGTDSLCTFFNQTWLRFTGRTMEQELGVGWAEGVHHEDLARCIDTYISAFNERSVFSMEYRLRRADGEYRWVLDRGTPRYAPDGTFAGYIGSCVDITEHKTLETQLRRAVRERDEFLSIASHELKTPLATLQLQLDRGLRALQVGKPERVLESTQRAAKQAQRLGSLVETLLDVSRVSGGRLELEVQTVDLAELARDAASHFDVGEGPIEVDAAAPVIGRWDRVRMEGVISNLLSNAAKYGPGKPIRVRVRAEGGKAILTVRDEGIGIAEVDQARIFERFERAVSTRNYGGLGLGLWIANEIVRAHNGEITVESSPGQGAAFTVLLPIEA